MSIHRSHRLARVALVACAGLALSSFSVASADVALPGNNPGLEALQQLFPGVVAHREKGRVLAFWGVPMTQAVTDGEAVAGFLAQHDEAFGAGRLTLEVARVNTLSNGKTVYHYKQSLGGLPVEYGRVKVVMHNDTDPATDAPRSSVVLASARVASMPEGGFAEDTVTSAQAVERVQRIARFAELDSWSTPELVVFFGEGDLQDWITPVRAWKFTGEKTAMDGNPAKHTFFVNAATNEIEHVRNNILHVDISGNVQAWVSPNNTADHSGNPPALRSMSEVLVRVQGQPNTTVRTDRNGNFTIPWSGTSPVTLEVGTALPGANDLVQQQIAETGGTPDVYTASATPGTPVSIQMNPASGRTESSTAEVNALHYLTVTRNYFADLAPSFAAQMDTIGSSAAFQVLPANVQVTGTCNAFYNGVSTNYYPAGGSCNNTAFASVINHEYGHHIVNRLGLPQSGFGEGYGDTMSILINDDTIIGRFFQTSGGVVRAPDTAGQVFPCNGAPIHTCGMLLGDFVIELRRALGLRYGSVPGLQVARQLHADWSVITDGGDTNLNSAHPLTVVEYLIADDDDQYLCDGTPNLAQIQTAATIKSIPLNLTLDTRLDVGIVSAIPETIEPGTPLTVLVQASNGSATLTPGSATIRYRHSATNAFYTAPLAPTATPGIFSATIPAANCGQRIEFNFQFGTSAGTVALPANCGQPGASTSYVVNVNTPFNIISTDTFENGVGAWTTAATATSGQWTWGTPIATAAQPGAGSAGVNCWFTGQGPVGGGLGDADVDNGSVTLTSPTFSLASTPNPVIQYDRWYSNGAGATPYTDVFRVQVSQDNGTTWLPLETVGPANSADTNPGWRSASISLASVNVQPSAQMRLRFIAEDAGTGSLVEAAIDNLRIAQSACLCNDIDFNNDGGTFDPTDIDDFLSVFSEGPCSTGNCDPIDFNNDGGTFDPTDIDAFLSVFSEGPCIR